MGSGGKVTTGYKYYLGVHFVLCHGPIDKVVRIEVGGNEAWLGEADASTAAPTRITINKPKLFGGEKREGGIAGDIDLLSGHPDQARNEYLLDKIGSALLSAYRGVTSVVLRQCYLGVNPYLKPWKFTAQRIHTRGDGSAQWYDEKAAIGAYTDSNTDLSYSDSLNSLQEFSLNSGTWSAFDTQGGILNIIPVTGHETSIISKPVGPYDALLGFRVQFRVNSIGTDDAGQVTIGPINLIPSRQLYYDSLQRITIGANYAAASIPLLSGPPEVGKWYEIESMVDEGGNSQTVILRSDGLELDRAENVPYAAVGFNSIVFGMENTGNGGGSSSFRDLQIWATVDTSYSDMNPAHIIRECLTDGVWGRGLPESEIGPSFAIAADQLFDEGLGLSFLWSEEAPVEEFVSEVLRHIDAVRYEDPETGLQELKLIRGDYDIGTLPVLDRSNSKITKFEIPALSELTNQVTVKYHKVADDNDAAITVQDTAAITMAGTIINQTYEYPGITNDTVASMVAQRDLAANSRPFARGAVTTNRTVADLKPGDVFILNDPDYGVDAMICRVAKRKDNGALNGEIALEFGEDVFGTEYSIFTQPPASGWTDPIGTAENFPQQTAFELPYVHLVRRLGDSYVSDVPEGIGYAAFVGSEPTAVNHINYELFIYPTGANPLTQEDEAIVGDFAEVAFVTTTASPIETDVSIEPFSGVESHSAGEFVLIGNAADSAREIAVLATDLDPGDTLVFLDRGTADTSPREISAGTALYLFNEDYTYSTEEFATGESASAYALPSTGREDYQGPYTYHHVDIASRVHLPYPPANVKVDGVYGFTPIEISSNQIVLTWNHRDRVLQSNLSVHWFIESDYGPEAGTTYRVEVDAVDAENNILQASYIDRDLGTVSTETIDLTIDVPPAGTQYLHIRLYSVRGGLDCLQPYETQVSVFEAPFNLTAVNVGA
ncbi:phage tail protein [Marinobacterium stanieri]|uniref:Putative phage tail protein n=1 Tax=Marinobacterium stanieri TaxID=49186 RepID=A0A1N6RQY1_9GAMM|nr:phage tail protein [Marinobacterium stanieri]SIQ31112.1 Putative phage tail protein [Marinobacterium stanieri]